RSISGIALTLTFAVILAGSIVRMTGSGMGCPDWPKCFGLLIPPTSLEEVVYNENRSYEPGQMVIMNDTLWVAQHATQSGVWQRTDWLKYPHHDYAIFNPFHTWVEYINRLATVVYGIPVLLLLPLSWLIFRSTRNRKPLLAAALINVTVLYEAWLGKLVVDGVLEKGSVTLHMAGSLALIGFLTWYRFVLMAKSKSYGDVLPKMKWVMLLIWLLALSQIFMGAQVREATDEIAMVQPDRGEWIAMMPDIFLIHRSMSWLLLIVALSASVVTYRSCKSWKGTGRVIVMVLISMLLGITLSEFEMPAFAQPLHLLSGALLFYAATRNVLEYFRASPSVSRGAQV
ncbi:MAG: COX15/CtaA family protein, partial [Flavobacteriales bacterium]